MGPFLEGLPRKGQRRWAVAYLEGLLLPGGRKSVEPLAERVAPGAVQQLHHFVAASPWDTAPLEDALARWADRLLGGPDATLVVDDLFLAKQGGHSVGVARQACDEAGRQANGQALVALTLCRGEAAVPVGLRLHLPEAWCADAARRREAGVPDGLGYRPRWRIALDELDARLAAGLRVGRVVAPAAYGGCAGFRRGLAERGLACALEAPAVDGPAAGPALDHTAIVWRGSPPAPHVVRLSALPLEGDGAGWLVRAEHAGYGGGGWLVDHAPGGPRRRRRRRCGRCGWRERRCGGCGARSGWTTSRAAAGGACTTTCCCASSRPPSCTTCGPGGRGRGGAGAPPGGPRRPS